MLGAHNGTFFCVYVSPPKTRRLLNNDDELSN